MGVFKNSYVYVCGVFVALAVLSACETGQIFGSKELVPYEEGPYSAPLALNPEPPSAFELAEVERVAKAIGESFANLDCNRGFNLSTVSVYQDVTRNTAQDVQDLRRRFISACNKMDAVATLGGFELAMWPTKIKLNSQLEDYDNFDVYYDFKGFAALRLLMGEDITSFFETTEEPFTIVYDRARKSAYVLTRASEIEAIIKEASSMRVNDFLSEE